MKDALQTLIDGGLASDKVQGICEDIVECDNDERWAVLLFWLHDDGQDDIAPDDVSECCYGSNMFDAPGAEYQVLTENEADEACKEYILDSLWAFVPDFLSSMTELPAEVFVSLQDQCEGANDTVYTLVKGSCGLDDFVEAAVSADGRGHFIGRYDGEEHEVRVGGEDFLVYRTN
jgi:hypothetical protein